MDLTDLGQYLNVLDELSNYESDTIEYLMKSYKNNDLKTSRGKKKCATKTLELMDEGKKLIKASPSSTFELLKKYSEAIAYAPNDSVELARAYGNRSAILCNAQLYEDSLRDIDRALALNYPDNLKSKLYARKAKNLLSLGPKHRVEAKKAMNDVRQWLEKLNEADKKIQLLKLKELSEQKSFDKPLKKPDNSFIVPDILDANQELKGTSKAIKLEYSEKFGRHFVATRDIKTSEILVKQKAYVSVLPQHLYYANCWNCMKRAWSGVPCKHCVNFVFCDEICRDKAWNNFHDLECPVLTNVENQGDTEMMAMRITIKALKEAESIESLKKMTEALDSLPDAHKQGLTKQKLDDFEYASIYRLTQSPSILKHILHSKTLEIFASFLITWMNTTKIFGENFNNIDELISSKLVIYLRELFLRNGAIYENNSYEGHYCQQNPLDAMENSGSMLSCLVSYFNHSCDANARLVYSGTTVGIRSVQMIKKGEQVFITYHSYGKPSEIDRRMRLKNHYGFWCECYACNHNWVSCTQLPSLENQTLSRNAVYNVQAAMTRFRKHLKNESHNKKIEQLLITDPRYISFLSQLLDVLYNNVSYPCREISLHKELLNCNYTYQSY